MCPCPCMGCMCVWVCETCIVYYLNGTGLCCAPPTCVVHHWPALCAMVHKGDLCPYVLKMQVSDAQCRSVVHNIVLYRWGCAQHSSHNPRPPKNIHKQYNQRQIFHALGLLDTQSSKQILGKSGTKIYQSTDYSQILLHAKFSSPFLCRNELCNAGIWLSSAILSESSRHSRDSVLTVKNLWLLRHCLIRGVDISKGPTINDLGEAQRK